MNEALKSHYKEVDSFYNSVNIKLLSSKQYDGMEDYTLEIQFVFRRLLDRHYTFFPGFEGEYEDMYNSFIQLRNQGIKTKSKYKESLMRFLNWCNWVTMGQDFR